MSTEIETFSTFNGMSRKAMFAGAPLMPTITLFGVSVVLGLLGMGQFGLQGLAVSIIFFPFFLWMRTMTENDDQALDVMGLEFLCLICKNNCVLFPRSIFINHTAIGRKTYVYQSYFQTLQIA